MKKNKWANRCPVDCKYCMVNHISIRQSKWKNTPRYGINKTAMFVTTIDGSNMADWFDPTLTGGEIIAFQGVDDGFNNKFKKDLKYIMGLSSSNAYRRVVVCTKYTKGTEQLKMMADAGDKACLNISLTGLNMLENTTTEARIELGELAKSMGIHVVYLVHPYIHGLTNLNFLKLVGESPNPIISVKGFRYSEENMGSWARELIPQSSLMEYRKGNEEEVMVGMDYVESIADRYDVSIVPLRQGTWGTGWNGETMGVSEDEAGDAINRLKDVCVISSSDPNGVWARVKQRRTYSGNLMDII